jgi:hypothetical protein
MVGMTNLYSVSDLCKKGKVVPATITYRARVLGIQPTYTEFTTGRRGTCRPKYYYDEFSAHRILSFRKKSQGKVYFIVCEESNTLKVGYTQKQLSRRLKALQTGNPFKLNVYLVIEGNKEDEAFYHNWFKEASTNGGTEWFYIDKLPVQLDELKLKVS